MKPLLFHLFYFIAINFLTLVLGYTLIKRRMLFVGWILMVITILTVCFIFLHDDPLFKMLSIIATTFLGMKVIAVAESYKHKPLTLTFKQWFAFATGWAGMRAEPFEKLSGVAVPGGWKMIRFGIIRMMIGLLLLFVAHLMIALPFNRQLIYIIESITLLAGLSLILHFGILSISAGVWRLFGVNTYLLFRQPAKATSLTEFWSKRWNIAFSEMTSIAVFKPLKSKIGSVAALMFAFVFSGLLHELALSVPVNSGYGLPLVYFIIQGSGVLTEKLLLSRNIRILQNSIIAKIWMVFWLILPMPLLFHRQFMIQIAFGSLVH